MEHLGNLQKPGLPTISEFPKGDSSTDLVLNLVLNLVLKLLRDTL